MGKNLPSDLGNTRLSIRNGNRRALAQAITLIESTRPDHRVEAEDLLETLLEYTGESLRLGISGPPGVGKSTFIEALGSFLIDNGYKIAVLAIDPSSKKGHGSVLGDKTRMPRISNSEKAFIRPTPNSGSLGGVARRTREAMLLCEAAGHDVIMVETVGVGQSETAVKDMVDIFILLAQPASGDELQGIKKGIMEMADLLIVNRADGDLLAAASRTQADYHSALRLLGAPKNDWSTPVLKCSALYDEGIPAVWDEIEKYSSLAKNNGLFSQVRRDQAVAWMWSEIEGTLSEQFRSGKNIKNKIDEFEKDVANGLLNPSAAAKSLVATFLSDN